MRFFIAFVLTFSCSVSFAQEDTTFADKIKIIDEVSVSFKSKTIYDKKHNYLLDFHVDSFGCYVLLKNGNHYLLSLLDEDFQMQSTLLLSFKPISLHRNCMQELYVISKDSVFKVAEELDEIDLYAPNTSTFYEEYFSHCQLETNNHLVYKELFKSNKVAHFYAIEKSNTERNSFYYAYDSLNIELATEWENVLRSDGIDPNANGQQLDIALILMEPEVFQRFTFYENVISKEDYLPLFTEDSVLLFFNQYNDSLVFFDTTSFNVQQQLPYTFHKIKGWQNQILKDPITGRYYTLFLNKGAIYIATLSSTNYEVLRSRKIDSDILTKRFMVYNGFLYYDSKDAIDESFNKLMRQRL